jgi:hypothetical protein
VGPTTSPPATNASTAIVAPSHVLGRAAVQRAADPIERREVPEHRVAQFGVQVQHELACVVLHRCRHQQRDRPGFRGLVVLDHRRLADPACARDPDRAVVNLAGQVQKPFGRTGFHDEPLVPYPIEAGRVMDCHREPLERGRFLVDQCAQQRQYAVVACLRPPLGSQRGGIGGWRPVPSPERASSPAAWVRGLIIDQPVELGSTGICDLVPVGLRMGPEVVLGQSEPLVRQRRPDLVGGKSLLDNAHQIRVDLLARVD